MPASTVHGSPGHVAAATWNSATYSAGMSPTGPLGTGTGAGAEPDGGAGADGGAGTGAPDPAPAGGTATGAGSESGWSLAGGGAAIAGADVSPSMSATRQPSAVGTTRSGTSRDVDVVVSPLCTSRRVVARSSTASGRSDTTSKWSTVAVTERSFPSAAPLPPSDGRSSCAASSGVAIRCRSAGFGDPVPALSN